MIPWVSPKFARIESASWANVSRGTSWPRAGIARGRASATTSVTIKAGRSRTRSERGKVLRHLRAIGEHRRQQAGQRAEDHDRREDRGLERAQRERRRDRPAAPREQVGAEVRGRVPAQDPGET